MSQGSGADPRIEIGLATDVGQVRTGNEDSIICEPLESKLVAEYGLFCAVADGMGGHASGEDASSMAVQVARDVYYAATSMDPLEAIKLAVIKANASVYDAGAGKTGRDHMGSTLTAAVLMRERLVVGHVGDSRCYVIQEEEIRQFTKDHSWVAEEVEAGRMTPEQAKVNPRRNIITRALGLRPEVEVDVYETTLEPGMGIVICSDGLHGLVSDEEILSYARRLRPADAVDALIAMANERGGPDNISVVIARVAGEGEDELDTSPGFPVLSEASVPTVQAPVLDPDAPPPPALEEVELPSPPPVSEPEHPTPRPQNVSDLPILTGSPASPPAAQPAAPQPVPQPAPAPQLPSQPPPTPSPSQPAAAQPAPAPQPAPQQPPAAEHAMDDMLTPREAVSEDMIATARTPVQHSRPAPQPRRQAGRSNGVAMIVVLLFLLAIGAGVGLLMFRLFS